MPDQLIMMLRSLTWSWLRSVALSGDRAYPLPLAWRTTAGCVRAGQKRLAIPRCQRKSEIGSPTRSFL